jgi:hypothetical protein
LEDPPKSAVQFVKIFVEMKVIEIFDGLSGVDCSINEQELASLPHPNDRKDYCTAWKILYVNTTPLYSSMCLGSTGMVAWFASWFNL